MPKILLVEDNPMYAGPAERYIKSKGYALDVARDYSEADYRLGNPDFDGVISDCFFPEETGSGKVLLGKGLVEKLAGSDRSEKKIAKGMELLGENICMDDQDMRKYARSMISNAEGDLSNYPVFRAIANLSEVMGKEVATMIVKNTLGMLYREDRAPKDYYGAMIKAIDDSESNQPLGILVAERAGELSIPLVLATSTHHHDILTQPIQNYASKMGWALVDCVPGKDDYKSTTQFWEEVIRRIEGMMR